MASGFGSEQRRHPRVARPKVVLRIPSVDRFREYYLKDLSQGGIFIKAEKLRPVGSELSLELWPPGWKEPLLMEARVVRAVDAEQAEATNQMQGMAVSFLPAANPEIEQQLQWLVSEHQEASEAAGDADIEEEASGDLVVEGLQDSVATLTSELSEARGQLEAYVEQAKALEEENAGLRAAFEEQNAQLRAQIDQLGQALEAQRRRSSGLSAAMEEVIADEEPPVLVATELPSEDLAVEVDPDLVLEEPVQDEPLQHLVPEELVQEELVQDELVQDELVQDELVQDELVQDELVRDEPLQAPPKSEGLHELGLELNFDPEDLADLTAGSAPAGDEGGPDALDLLADSRAEELVEEAPQNAPEPQDEELKALAAFNASLTFKTRLMPGGSLGGFRSEYEDEALLAELLGAAPTFATLLSQTEGKIEENTLRLLLQRFQRKGLVSLRS